MDKWGVGAIGRTKLWTVVAKSHSVWPSTTVLASWMTDTGKARAILDPCTDRQLLGNQIMQVYLPHWPLLWRIFYPLVNWLFSFRWLLIWNDRRHCFISMFAEISKRLCYQIWICRRVGDQISLRLEQNNQYPLGSCNQPITAHGSIKHST